MYKNIQGMLISFIFVFTIISISTILDKKRILSKEGTRKFIHIGVSNWWIIAMIYFNNKIYASIAPLIFIVINYASYKLNLVKAMERGAGKRDLGTVYYPISLFVLVVLSFSKFSAPYVGALGILIMGYGDGFAAIIGKKVGTHNIKIGDKEKTVEGTVAMLLISFFISYAVLYLYSPQMILIKSLVISVFAAFVEAFSPHGLDNLTVPLLTWLIYQLLFFV